MEALLAFNPGLCAALNSVEWDAQGRVSHQALVQVLRALGNARKPPQQTAAAAAGAKGSLDELAAAAAAAAGAGAAHTQQQAQLGSPAAGRVCGAGADGGGIGDGALRGACVHVATAAPAAAPGANDAAHADTPPSTADGTTTCSSGRSSGRPSLSIDVTTLPRMSDASSSGASSSESSSLSCQEPGATPDPAGNTAGPIIMARAPASCCPPLSRQSANANTQAAPADGADSSTDSSSHSSSGGGGAGVRKHRHCATPGVALHHPVSIFSGSGASNPSSQAHTLVHFVDGDNDAAPAVAASQHGSSTRRPRTAPGHMQQHADRRHPPTPGDSLGLPVSIFSGSGGSVESGLARPAPLQGTHHRQSQAAQHEHLVHFKEPSGSAGMVASGGLHTRQAQTGRGQPALISPPDEAARARALTSSSSNCNTSAPRRISWGERSVVIEDAAKQPERLGRASSTEPRAAGHVSAVVAAWGHDASAAADSRHPQQPALAAAESRRCGGVSTLLARLSPELAAEVQQQRSGKRPPTPGDCTTHGNMFADGAADGSQQQRRPSSGSEQFRQHVPSPGDCQPGGAAASAPVTGLLQRSPDVAADMQQQRWRAKLAERPPTPGAGLKQPAANIFDERSTTTLSHQAGQPSPAPSGAAATAAAASALEIVSPSTAGAVLLSHNPELALDRQQQQWDRKLRQRPPTPAAGNAHGRFFAGDDDGDDSEAEDRPRQPAAPPRGKGTAAASAATSSGGGLRAPAGAGQARSPDLARVTRRSNGSSSSDSDRDDEGRMGGAGLSEVASPQPTGERRSSPLQRSTSANDPHPDACGSPAGQHTPSRLQRSASPADRDPDRSSPLSRNSSTARM